ncbi:DUF2460 domain-containing protein [Limnohabitans sp.]
MPSLINLQALLETAGNVCVSRTNASFLLEAGGIRCTQSALSVLYEPANPSSHISAQTVSEALMDGPSRTFASGLYSSLLMEAQASVLACQLVLQVMYGYDEPSPNAQELQPVSDHLLPNLPGLAWSVKKRPKFNTAIASHLSGREVRVSNYAYPIWEWELKYEFLRADAHAELQLLMGFFLARAGAFDTFLYRDPTENNQIQTFLLAVGDGATTKFTLTKSYGGFTEPCGYVDTSSLVISFLALGASVPLDQTTGWTFVSPNQVVFATPPPVGTNVLVSFSWYYRVRFADDSQDYENFMFNLWQLKKLSIQSVKP